MGVTNRQLEKCHYSVSYLPLTGEIKKITDSRGQRYVYFMGEKYVLKASLISGCKGQNYRVLVGGSRLIVTHSFISKKLQRNVTLPKVSSLKGSLLVEEEPHVSFTFCLSSCSVTKSKLWALDYLLFSG